MLTNQTFVVDPDRLDKITASHSFRGRDLRLAVLGAQLQGARLDEAQLQGARLDEAQLQGAYLQSAQLQGASLDGAQLQGAVLAWAKLQGARLGKAQLQGAWLVKAQLQGARLDHAQLQGASLIGAQLKGASLDGAQLQGASLDGAQLQGAWLVKAQLQGASLDEAQLQGASLDEAQLQGAGLVSVWVWRAFGTPNLYLADLRNIDARRKPWKDNETFGEWRDAIANSVPASFLRDPAIKRLTALDPIGKDVLDQRYWDRAHSSQPQGEEVLGKRAMFLADLACSEDEDSVPYVALGLLRNVSRKRDPPFLDAGGLKLFTDRLLKGKSDPTTCPGVRGFTDTDWKNLSKLSSETLMSR